MRRNYSNIPFERYADDILVHCKSEKQAKWVKTVIERRLKHCRLELNAEKTKIVYCKDSSRRVNYQHRKFDFLGYTFRPRRSKSGLRNRRLTCLYTGTLLNNWLLDRSRMSWEAHVRLREDLEWDSLGLLDSQVAPNRKNLNIWSFSTDVFVNLHLPFRSISDSKQKLV
jgi:hypothetical protein